MSEIKKEYNRRWRATQVRTPEGRAKLMWGDMRARVRNDTLYTKQGIKIMMTRQEFIDFAVKDPVLPELIKNHKDLRTAPSVDRIDPEGHYSLDNIQFITFSENARRAYPPLPLWDMEKFERGLCAYPLCKNKAGSRGRGAGRRRHCWGHRGLYAKGRSKPKKV